MLGIPTFPKSCELSHPVAAVIISRSGTASLIIDPQRPARRGKEQSLIQAIARANHWFELLRSGRVQSIREIANQNDFSTQYVSRYLRLAFLAPDIVEAILDGRQPPGISVRKLTNNKQMPSDWTEQRQLLGFPAP